MLLLVSQDSDAFYKNDNLSKAKSDRDGLIQQVVTYVRDGRTVTRKQWVRSEFAEHAKKSEEQKRQAEANAKKRENDKQKHNLEEENAKKRTEDKRAYKKKVAQKEELKGTGRPKVAEFDEKRKKLNNKRKQEEKERKKKEASRKKESGKKDKEKEHGRYGQREQTTAQNKAEEKMLHT